MRHAGEAEGVTGVEGEAAGARSPALGWFELRMARSVWQAIPGVWLAPRRRRGGSTIGLPKPQSKAAHSDGCGLFGVGGIRQSLRRQDTEVGRQGSHG